MLTLNVTKLTNQIFTLQEIWTKQNKNNKSKTTFEIYIYTIVYIYKKNIFLKVNKHTEESLYSEPRYSFGEIYIENPPDNCRLSSIYLHPQQIKNKNKSKIYTLNTTIRILFYIDHNLLTFGFELLT